MERTGWRRIEFITNSGCRDIDIKPASLIFLRSDLDIPVVFVNYRFYDSEAEPVSFSYSLLLKKGEIVVGLKLYIRLAVFISLVYSGLSHGDVYYVDPLNGSIDGDGSAGSPWRTLSEVFEDGLIETREFENHPAGYGDPLIPKNEGAPVTAGDTIKLLDGYHGSIFAAEYYNEDYIVIMALEGDEPRLGSVQLRSCSKWIISGLTISPSFDPEYTVKTLVDFASHGWTGPGYDCIVENCTGFSVSDASGWSQGNWDTLSCNAVSLSGNNMTARGNIFRNVNFGISVSGDSCLVEYNTIENFAGDGLRGLGDYGVFEYNTVKNCYNVNENHDDGFQSWSYGEGGVGTETVYGLVLRGNIIINYEDPQQPFQGGLQGIGCFDGMFENWLVENNVIITDHWHGITLMGALNCNIINNTVVNRSSSPDAGPPWISIGDHKDGTASSGCIVRNNLTTALNLADEGVTEDHNIIIENPDDYFLDWAGFDMHLLEGCPAVDSANSELAPEIDADGTSRPQGAGIDAGAYEYTDINRINSEFRRAGLNPVINIYPNPFVSRIKISGQVLDIKGVNAVIASSNGRITRRLEMCEFNCSEVEWDGKDSYGAEAAPGVYYLIIRLEGSRFEYNRSVRFIKM